MAGDAPPLPSKGAMRRRKLKLRAASLDNSGSGELALHLALENTSISPPSTGTFATGLDTHVTSTEHVCNLDAAPVPPPMPFTASSHPSHEPRGAIATSSVNANEPNRSFPADSTVAGPSAPATPRSLQNSASSPLLLASDDAATPLPAVPAASNRLVLTIPPPSRSLTAASPGPAELSFETTSVAPGLGSTTCSNGLTKLQSIASSALQQRAPSRQEQKAAAAAREHGAKFRVAVFESVGDSLIVSVTTGDDWRLLDDHAREISFKHMDLTYHMILSLLAIGLNIKYPAKDTVFWWLQNAALSGGDSPAATWPGLLWQMADDRRDELGRSLFDLFAADFFNCSDGTHVTEGNDPESLRRFEESLRDGFSLACEEALHPEDFHDSDLGDDGDGAGWGLESGSD